MLSAMGTQSPCCAALLVSTSSSPAEASIRQAYLASGERSTTRVRIKTGPMQRDYGADVPKRYACAMALSALVENLNMFARRARKRRREQEKMR